MKLQRSDNRIIGGVASGIAQTYGLDVTLVRVVLAVLAIFGAGIPIYLVSWFIIPDKRGHAGIDILHK